VEQSFWGERIIFRTSYFHNQFGKEIESVGATLLPNLIPNLTPAEKQELITTSAPTFSTTPASMSTPEPSVHRASRRPSRAASANTLLPRRLYYLDAVVQRSFDSDNEALMGGYAPTYPYGCSLARQTVSASGHTRHWWARDPSPRAAFRLLHATSRKRSSRPASHQPLPAAATIQPTWRTPMRLLLTPTGISAATASSCPTQPRLGLRQAGPGRKLQTALMARHLRPGGKTSPTTGTSPHRLSQPALQLPGRPAHSVDQDGRPMRDSPHIPRSGIRDERGGPELRTRYPH